MNQLTEESQPEITRHAKDYYQSSYTNITSHKKHVVVCGRNRRTNLYLVYVLSGEIQMNAIVDMLDPLLELYIAPTWIENGNSLAWLTKEECTDPNMYAEDPLEDHSFFPITKESN